MMTTTATQTPATPRQNGTTRASQDIVGVFDGYTQVFQAAHTMSGSVREEAKMMEHPLEDGAVITDHKVIQPVEIDLDMILPAAVYRDVFEDIRTLFHESRVLSVATRARTYEDMVIAAMPHEESPEHLDALKLTLKLKEIRMVSAQFVESPYKAKSPHQRSTVDRGEVQAQPVPRSEKRASWARGVYSGGKS